MHLIGNSLKFSAYNAESACGAELTEDEALYAVALKIEPTFNGDCTPGDLFAYLYDKALRSIALSTRPEVASLLSATTTATLFYQCVHLEMTLDLLGIYRITEILSRLPNLRSIYVRVGPTEITTKHVDLLRSGLKSCPRVTRFAIECWDYTGGPARELLDFSKQPQFESFTILGGCFDGNHVQRLLDDLQPNLSAFQLRDVCIDGGIPKGFHVNSTALRSLGFVGCRLDASSYAHLLAQNVLPVNLVTLNLACNDTRAHDLTGMISAFLVRTRVRVLDLSRNNLSKEVIQFFHENAVAGKGLGTLEVVNISAGHAPSANAFHKARLYAEDCVAKKEGGTKVHEVVLVSSDSMIRFCNGIAHKKMFPFLTTRLERGIA